MQYIAASKRRKVSYFYFFLSWFIVFEFIGKKYWIESRIKRRCFSVWLWQIGFGSKNVSKCFCKVHRTHCMSFCDLSQNNDVTGICSKRTFTFTSIHGADHTNYLTTIVGISHFRTVWMTFSTAVTCRHDFPKIISKLP